MTAIRLGKPLAECGYALQPNAEQYLRSRSQLEQIYPLELLQETTSIAARCAFSLDELRYQYPDELTGTDETYAAYLRRMVEEGITRRFPDGISAKVREQIEHELSLIAELNYEPYFLTVFDIVRHRPLTRHSLPGTRLGSQFRSVLLPGHHGDRSGAQQFAV